MQKDEPIVGHIRQTLQPQKVLQETVKMVFLLIKALGCSSVLCVEDQQPNRLLIVLLFLHVMYGSPGSS